MYKNKGEHSYVIKIMQTICSNYAISKALNLRAKPKAM